MPKIIQSLLISSSILTIISCSSEVPNNQPSDHADYVVIGKSVNTRQKHDGELNLLNTVFFAEIFQTKEAVAAGGTVMNGYLSGPGKAAEDLEFSNDEARYLTGGRRETIEELTEIFPKEKIIFFMSPRHPREGGVQSKIKRAAPKNRPSSNY